MPNRILKESICTSETIAELTPFEETVFYRLIVNCDDYGRFDARPAILKGRLYPLANVTNAAIQNALVKLSTVGILELYQVEGRAYLQLCTWTRHQQTRASKSKYPAPEEGSCMQMKSSAIKCGQAHTDVPVNENVNDTRETRNGNMPGAAEAASGPPTVSLMLNDKSHYGVPQTDIDEWAKLYPAVDILQELRKMAGWCEANPSKRKTRSGIRRFITNWLAKEQDRGGSKAKGEERNRSYDIDELEEMSHFDLPENL